MSILTEPAPDRIVSNQYEVLFHRHPGNPILTGKDWRRADLQKRYTGYFSAYLSRKIALLDVRR